MSEAGRRRLWLALVALAAGACVASLVRDVDTPWQVAAGRWILAHAAVPSRDPFSFTFHGAPWRDHSPLAQVTLALAHGAAGWAGVVAWQVVLTAALALAGVASAVRRGARVEIAASLALLALVAETAALAPRPSLLASLLIVFALDALLDVGARPGEPACVDVSRPSTRSCCRRTRRTRWCPSSRRRSSSRGWCAAIAGGRGG